MHFVWLKIIRLRRTRKRADDQSDVSGVIEIVVGPIGGHEQFVPKANELQNMNAHPYKPGKESLKLVAWKIHNGFVSSYGSHGTKIIVLKRGEAFSLA